ncbi:MULTISPECIES: substrate-binding domain-containing protein [unclassified Bifidobacterium]|uniref:substrate-binding domain-containing protein n=1 Tax=unclassified Bifidobacterium TaxID=2608897 RepID=UPI00226B6C6E|nr:MULTISPECIES: substrate-binding domain-containing protein [unclassified Bifidobacterium]
MRTNASSEKKAGRKGNLDRASSGGDTHSRTSSGVSSPAMDKASSQDRAAVVRRNRIGVALPEPSFIWPSVTEAIRRMAAEQFGLDIVAEETSYETFPEVDILEDLATDPQMLGLIVAPSIEPDVASETWQWLTECQLPVTILERHPPQWLPGFFDSVHTDHPAGVRRGLQHFRQHGHHRVGLALGSTPTAGDIELGWQLMMREGDGLEQTFLLKDKQPYAAEDVEQVVQTILETHTTAVLVHPDYLSIALVQALERRGCRIPNDLSMITIDGYTKRLTVMRSSAQDLASAALRLQVRRIQDPDQRIEHVCIEPALIDRGSVADMAEK